MNIEIKFRNLLTNQIVDASAFPADATLQRRYSMSKREMQNVVVVHHADGDEFIGVQVYLADGEYINI
jgi:hypothetical protein